MARRRVRLTDEQKRARALADLVRQLDDIEEYLPELPRRHKMISDDYLTGIVTDTANLAWPVGTQTRVVRDGEVTILVFQLPAMGAFTVRVTGNAYTDIIAIESGFGLVKNTMPPPLGLSLK